MTAVASSEVLPRAEARPPADAAGIVETAHVFGDGLVGVLSRPEGPVEGRAALILLNAGMVHRAGPFRMYVQMARALAKAGFAVFRFDQSGLGDSPVSTQASADRKRGEVAAAMDLVARLTGLRKFVLGGLCSGADDAFNIAPHEARVVGLLMLDGVGYPTFGHRLRYYVPRLLNPAKVLRGILRLARRREEGGASDIDPNNFRDFPTREEAIQRFEQLDARGVNALLIHTGGIDRYFNHRRQTVECFGSVMRSPRMTTEYWRDCDHTFYVREHRERLLRTAVEWMRSRFGG